MKRIKLLVAMVAAMMVMVALGAAPAMAQPAGCFFDGNGNLVCPNQGFPNQFVSPFVGDFEEAGEHVGPPHRIGDLVCFKVRDRDIFGNTIDRFWECITPEGDVIEI